MKLPKFTPRGLTYCCGVSILKSVLWQEYRPAYLAGQAVSAIPSQSSGESEPKKLGRNFPGLEKVYAYLLLFLSFYPIENITYLIHLHLLENKRKDC